MAKLVADGATIHCSMGSSPSSLRVVRPFSVDEHALATVADHAPAVNIMPFGMCRSTANPQVITATAAAQGVLTPQPCVPATSAPWSGGSPHVTIADQAAITESSTCSCQWAGTVSVASAGNTRASDD